MSGVVLTFRFTSHTLGSGLQHFPGPGGQHSILPPHLASDSEKPSAEAKSVGSESGCLGSDVALSHSGCDNTGKPLTLS